MISFQLSPKWDRLWKKALLTGITEQEGSYLAEVTTGKGYGMHGLNRRTFLFNIDCIDYLCQDPHETDLRFFHYEDITDSNSCSCIIQQIQPDEFCNLLVQSHLTASFDEPENKTISEVLVLRPKSLDGFSGCLLFRKLGSDQGNNRQHVDMTTQRAEISRVFSLRGPISGAKWAL